MYKTNLGALDSEWDTDFAGRDMHLSLTFSRETASRVADLRAVAPQALTFHDAASAFDASDLVAVEALELFSMHVCSACGQNHRTDDHDRLYVKDEDEGSSDVANTNDDYAGDTTTTGVLTAGVDATGVIEVAYDQDWFAFQVEAGTSYVFNQFGSGDANILSDTYLYLYDSAGNEIAFNDDFNGLFSQITFTATETGTIYVGAGAYGGNTGSYTVTAAEFVAPEDDYAGDTTTDGVLTLETDATGSIEVGGDSDWFAFDVVAGESYSFLMQPDNTNGTGIAIADLYLFDSTGAQIGFEFMGNALIFTSDVTGTVYLGATGFSSYTGDYTVSAETYVVPEDDYADDTSTTGTLAVDGQSTGSIEVQGDADWFAVQVEAGKIYTFTIAGDFTNNSALSLPGLQLYDGTGAFLTETIGSDTELTWTATDTGTLYLSALSFYGYTGDYSLSMVEQLPPEPLTEEQRNGAEDVAIGGRASGTIDVADETDVFSIEVVAGQDYTVFLIRDTEDALDNPMLTLYDAEGNFVQRVDDVATFDWNSRLDFTATETGTLYLTAQTSDGVDSNLDLYLPNSDGTGGYSLYVERADERADFTSTEVANFLVNGFSPFANAWQSDTITYDVSSLPGPAQTLAILAMQAWADLTPLNFVEAAPGEAANITFQDTDLGSAYATFLGPNSNNQVLINVGSDWSGGLATNPDGSYDEDPFANVDDYLYQTYLHEVGHALGLGHSGAYNAGQATPISYDYSRLYNQDFWTMTVMSYFSQSEAGTGDFRFILSPQEADIIAIQSLYGANTTTRSGDTTYGFNTTEAGTVYDFTMYDDNGGRPPAITLYDTGGVDTIDLSGFTGNQVVYLTGGQRSTIGGTAAAPGALNGILNIALGTVIEGAIGGSGDDQLLGNAADNILTGNGGNDLLRGYEGADTLDGGAGDDILDADGGDDTMSGGDGNDILRGDNGNDTMNGDAGADVLFTGAGDDVAYGGEGADILYGTGGLDTLYGDAGNDILYGGADDDTLYGGADDDRLIGHGGNDTMDGGDGDDRLFGRDGDDVMAGGAGMDRLIGDAGDDFLAGNDGTDILLGGLGNDSLFGDAGDDAMFGQDGIDTLYGGMGRDLVNGGAGDDLLYGGADNDRLKGGEGADQLYGDDGNDRLIGEAGNDWLDGGAGVDVLAGGTGADVFANTAAGTDAVTDFEVAFDRVAVEGSSIADVAVQVGTAVLVQTGVGSYIRLANTDLADLTDGNFIFGSTPPASSAPVSAEWLDDAMPLLMSDMMELQGDWDAIF